MEKSIDQTISRYLNGCCIYLNYINFLTIDNHVFTNSNGDRPLMKVTTCFVGATSSPKILVQNCLLENNVSSILNFYPKVVSKLRLCTIKYQYNFPCHGVICKRQHHVLCYFVYISYFKTVSQLPKGFDLWLLITKKDDVHGTRQLHNPT